MRTPADRKQGAAIRFVVASVAALLCCVPARALPAGAGRIDALEGAVTVVSRGAERPASTDMEVEEGDTLRTGTSAWALVEMIDGGSLTLRPDTVLTIATYRYSGHDDGSEKSVLSLVRGALRSITGSIGRYQPRNYTITTPTATLGVRGTDHEPAYYPPDARGGRLEHGAGTYDKVNDGETFIRTPKGEVRLKSGQYGFAQHDLRRPPRLLAKPPRFYQRHAGFDRKVAERRRELHRRIEEKQKRRLEKPRHADKQLKRAPKSDDERAEHRKSRRESKQDEQRERQRELRREKLHERQQERERRRQEKKREKHEKREK